jgi:hypothetical protein
MSALENDMIADAINEINTLSTPTVAKPRRGVAKKSGATAPEQPAVENPVVPDENPIVPVVPVENYEVKYWDMVRQNTELRSKVAELEARIASIPATEKVGFREKDTHTRIDANTKLAVETKYYDAKKTDEYQLGMRMLGCDTKQKNNSSKYTKTSNNTYYSLFKKGIVEDVNTKAKYPLRGDTINVIDTEGNSVVLKMMILP